MSYTEMNFGGGGASSAEKVSYNNATSGLSADNVQGAIDELGKDITTLSVPISGSANATFESRWTPSSGASSSITYMRLGSLVLLTVNLAVAQVTSSANELIATVHDDFLLPDIGVKAIPLDPSFTKGNWLYINNDGKIYARWNYDLATNWMMIYTCQNPMPTP